MFLVTAGHIILRKGIFAVHPRDATYARTVSRFAPTALYVPFPSCVLHPAPSAPAGNTHVATYWLLWTHRKAGKSLLAPGRLPGDHAADLLDANNISRHEKHGNMRSAKSKGVGEEQHIARAKRTARSYAFTGLLH